MCRLLIVRAEKEFLIGSHLRKFAEISQQSTEYQGHGWGYCYLEGNDWKFYKNIKPIWEDNLNIDKKTRLLVVHARSAFQDKDIVIENNMPFYDGKYVYIFNGELHGVKLRAEGRIGAEKIFNYIKRFDKGDMLEALNTGTEIIVNNSSYVKAMNIILTDREKIYLATIFNEQPEYFTMYKKQTDNMIMLCSMPYPEEEWQKITNHSVEVY